MTKSKNRVYQLWNQMTLLKLNLKILPMLFSGAVSKNVLVEPLFLNTRVWSDDSSISSKLPMGAGGLEYANTEVKIAL